MNKIIVISVIALIIYVLSKTPKMEKTVSYSFNPSDKDYIESQFNEIKGEFSKDTLQKIEKVYRLETAHFKSGQYLQSLSPGLVYSIDGKKLGWNLNEYNVIGFTKPFKVGGKEFVYVAFDSLAEGMRFLGNYIERKGGNAANWYSNNVDDQNEYRNKLNSIVNRYV